MSDSDEALRTILCSIRKIDDLWNEAALGWRDEVAHDFHRSHLLPLSAALEAYGEALERLIETVEIAERR